jgi:hypothetical protein
MKRNRVEPIESLCQLGLLAACVAFVFTGHDHWAITMLAILVLSML